MSDFLMRLACVALVAAPSAGLAEGPAAQPAGSVRSRETAQSFLATIYKAYEAQDAIGVFQMEPESLAQYFEPQLAGALLKNLSAATARALEPEPKGDAFVNSFCWHIASLQIRALRIDVRESGGERATGRVTFRNFDVPKVIEINLVFRPEGWRISDMSYGPRQSLRLLLGLEPGGGAEQLTVDALAARFKRAVMDGDVEALAAMTDPSGLVGGDPLVSGREMVLKSLQARRGSIYMTLLSTKEERAASGRHYSAGFLSHRDFFKAHPDVPAKMEKWGGSFVAARWSTTMRDPNRWTGPVVIVARDFLGQAWIRGIDDAMD